MFKLKYIHVIPSASAALPVINIFFPIVCYRYQLRTNITAKG